MFRNVFCTHQHKLLQVSLLKSGFRRCKEGLTEFCYLKMASEDMTQVSVCHVFCYFKMVLEDTSGITFCNFKVASKDTRKGLTIQCILLFQVGFRPHKTGLTEFGYFMFVSDSVACGTSVVFYKYSGFPH